MSMLSMSQGMDDGLTRRAQGFDHLEEIAIVWQADEEEEMI